MNWFTGMNKMAVGANSEIKTFNKSFDLWEWAGN